MNWELCVSISAMVITIFVCIANMISAHYAKLSYLDDNKAYISFYFEAYYIGNFEKIVIFKNFGKSEGSILKIEYDDNLPEYIKDFLKQMEGRTIMPGQKISCWVNPDDHEIPIKISYKYSTLNKEYNYTVDTHLEKSNKELYTRVSNVDDKNLPKELVNVLKHIYSKL